MPEVVASDGKRAKSLAWVRSDEKCADAAGSGSQNPALRSDSEVVVEIRASRSFHDVRQAVSLPAVDSTAEGSR